MFLRPVLPLILATGAVAAGAHQSSAGRAADRFRLDMPTPEESATPAAAPPVVPEDTTVTAAPADAPASEGARVAYTLDTPIADLIANPATKAVLDRDLPGLSGDENLDKFDRLGLKQFQPLTGGQLTDAMLAKVAKDLAATGGAALAMPARPAAGRKSRDESR